MTDTKKSPKKQVYRLTDTVIKRWTRSLLAILILGIVGGFAVMGYAAVAYGNVPSDELPNWIFPTVITLFSIGVGVPLILGAVLGGLAIHRFGWIPLLLVVGGLITTGFASTKELAFLEPYAVIAMIAGVIGIYVIAIVSTDVPVWIQLPIAGSPRLYLRGKNKKK